MTFTFDFIDQRHYHRIESWNLYFLQPPFLQGYTDAVAGKGASLYNTFDFADGAIARIYRRALNERLAYSQHTRVYDVKFQSVANGLIINLEGQWDSRRHERPLCLIIGSTKSTPVVCMI